MPLASRELPLPQPPVNHISISSHPPSAPQILSFEENQRPYTNSHIPTNRSVQAMQNPRSVVGAKGEGKRENWDWILILQTGFQIVDAIIVSLHIVNGRLLPSTVRTFDEFSRTSNNTAHRYIDPLHEYVYLAIYFIYEIFKYNYTIFFFFFFLFCFFCLLFHLHNLALDLFCHENLTVLSPP